MPVLLRGVGLSNPEPITHDDPNDRADDAVENAGEAMDGTVVAEAVDSSWDASEGDATDQAQPA